MYSHPAFISIEKFSPEWMVKSQILTTLKLKNLVCSQYKSIGLIFGSDFNLHKFTFYMLLIAVQDFLLKHMNIFGSMTSACFTEGP